VQRGEVSHERSYLPPEKVLKKRVKLEHRYTGEVYWFRIGSTLDPCISRWQREHGAEDEGVERKNALWNTEKQVFDLHPREEYKDMVTKAAS
jgi:hypothetical protein